MQAALALDRHSFRKVCGRFATGIAVATVTGPSGSPHGLTVNSFTSVSCEPPLVLVCIDYRAKALLNFRSSAYYGINILREDQRSLSVRFSERQDDRFEQVQWHRGVTGVPLLEGCIASLECCVNQTVEAGDHAIFIAEVVRAEYRDGEPLIYWGSKYRHLLP